MTALARSKFLAQIKIVVDQQFFVFFNCANTGEPEAPPFLFDGTIGKAAMIDVPCRTPLRASVHIMSGVELDNMIRAAL